jgi:hypothetical protein
MATKMRKKSDLQELNVDPQHLTSADRHLIADLAGKGKKMVDAVIRGDRHNPTIASLAKAIIQQKGEMKKSLLKTKYRTENIKPHLDHAQ